MPAIVTLTTPAIGLIRALFYIFMMGGGVLLIAMALDRSGRAAERDSARRAAARRAREEAREQEIIDNMKSINTKTQRHEDTKKRMEA